MSVLEGWVRGILFLAIFSGVLVVIMTFGIWAYHKPQMAIDPICADRRCATLITIKPDGFNAPHEYHLAFRELYGRHNEFIVWDAASDPLPEPRLSFGIARPRVTWQAGVLRIDHRLPAPHRVGTLPDGWTVRLQPIREPAER